ncbi:hypothetical protein ACGVWS_12090 [Enterobacteriaceae bacterium LUAb1]
MKAVCVSLSLSVLFSLTIPPCFASSDIHANQPGLNLPNLLTDDNQQSNNDSWFPIGHKWAEDKGYELPETWGAGVSYMNIRQNINVDSINFSDLSIEIFGHEIPIPGDIINIKAGKTREYSKTETARFDGWIFPFMNIYAVVGHTKGHSISQVGVCSSDGCPPEMQNIDFKLNFKGTTWGGGTTLAYGYDNIFATADFNWTRTNFNILDGSIRAFTFTPRVGYRMPLPQWATFTSYPSAISFWVGSMYQDTQQDFRGKISDLHMPAQLTELVNFVNSKDNGKFNVKQHLKSPWNVVAGARYELMPQLNINAEVGFAERNSLLVSGEYRF